MTAVLLELKQIPLNVLFLQHLRLFRLASVYYSDRNVREAAVRAGDKMMAGKRESSVATSFSTNALRFPSAHHFRPSTPPQSLYAETRVSQDDSTSTREYFRAAKRDVSPMAGFRSDSPGIFGDQLLGPRGPRASLGGREMGTKLN